MNKIKLVYISSFNFLIKSTVSSISINIKNKINIK